MKDRQNKGDLEIQKTGIVIESGLCAPIPITRSGCQSGAKAQRISCLVYATEDLQEKSSILSGHLPLHHIK